MYGISFDMSDEAMKDDFVLPFGKAKIEREGLTQLISNVLVYDNISIKLTYFV